MTKDESDPRALAYVCQHQDTYNLFYIKMANLVTTHSTKRETQCYYNIVGVFFILTTIQSATVPIKVKIKGNMTAHIVLIYAQTVGKCI